MGFPTLWYLNKHKNEENHRKKDENRGRKQKAPRFVDSVDDEDDDIVMDNLPRPSFPQATEHILGMEDFDDDDIEMNNLPGPSSAPQTTEQIPDMESETIDDASEIEIEPVIEAPQKRKRGRPKKTANQEQLKSQMPRRSTRSRN